MGIVAGSHRKGVGDITAETPLQEGAISEALGDDYRLRSGMRANGGTIVRYFEAMKENQLALVIDGENGTVSRIDVLDKAIPADNGVEIGTPFGDLYKKRRASARKPTRRMMRAWSAKRLTASTSAMCSAVNGAARRS